MRQLIDREEVLEKIEEMKDIMEWLCSFPDVDAKDSYLVNLMTLDDALGTVAEATDAIKSLPTHKAEEEEWLKTTDIEPEDKEWYLVECCGSCYKWIVQWCAEQKAFLKIDSTGATGRVFSAAGVRYRPLPQPPEVEK